MVSKFYGSYRLYKTFVRTNGAILSIKAHILKTSVMSNQFAFIKEDKIDIVFFVSPPLALSSKLLEQVESKMVKTYLY